MESNFLKDRFSLPALLIIAGLVLLAGLVWLLVAARPLVDSLLIAALLAYLLDPLVRGLERRWRISRAKAANLVYAVLILLLIGLVTAVGTAAWGQIPRLAAEFREALAEIGSWLDRPVDLFGFHLEPRDWLQGLQRSTGNAMSSMPVGSFSILAEITSNLLWSLVVFVSLYYFLKDGPRIKPWLVHLLPPAYQPEGGHLLDKLDQVWGTFLRMQLLIFAILGFLLVSSTGLIIWLFRNGWLPLSPLGLTVLLILVYVGVQQIDNLWLRPQLLGRTLRLHPGIVFVGLIAALALSGLLGAIIIVPVMASLKVIGYYLHAKILGRPVWPAEPAEGIALPVDSLRREETTITTIRESELGVERFDLLPADDKRPKGS